MNQVFSEKGMLRAKIYKKKLFSHTFKYNINKMSKTKKIVSLNKYYLLRLQRLVCTTTDTIEASIVFFFDKLLAKIKSF